MHQAAFDVLGINARYTLWETPPGTLSERIASLRSPDILGANVTIPYKQEIMALIDECDPLAARVGAVNTIVNRKGYLVGYNTDAPGFMRALTECTTYQSHWKNVVAGLGSALAIAPLAAIGLKVVILGTGGAARAAAVALVENEVAELAVLGRTDRHVDELLQHLCSLTALLDSATRVHGTTLSSSDACLFLSTADVLINATSVGLRPDDKTALIDIHLLPTNSLVIDMIFNPPLTPLLQAAQAHGCRIQNGLSMLLYQGALSFELWTNRTAPIEHMRTALGLV
jgi:shikimate dehydrogenase